MDNITRLIIEQLDTKTLRAIAKYCADYINYSVDYKQVINKYGVKLRADDIAELQEYCKFMLVMKQAATPEQATLEQKEANASNCDNIQSTMAESETAMSKKKEKK